MDLIIRNNFRASPKYPVSPRSIPKGIMTSLWGKARVDNNITSKKVT